ncbi:MAG: hypothetical protein EB027_07990, partial [Actinobacteria bacterium]|nr:hypothetical protein [Actinomycetota bacterium]
LLKTAGGNIAVNAAVTSSQRSVSIDAAGDLSFGASGAVNALGSGTQKGQTIDLLATGAIAMAAGSVLNTNHGNNGNQRIQAGTSVSLGRITAGTGAVSVVAGNGAILRTAGTPPDITAGSVRLEASGAIGSAASPFRTSMGTLAASAGAVGVFIEEVDALVIGSVSPVSVNRVNSQGVASANTTGVALAGVSAASGGHVIVRASTSPTLTGDLTISSPVTASGAGEVLLQAASGALVVNQAVDGGSGDVTLMSSGSQTYGASGDISTTAGTIDLVATGASSTITMDGGTSLTTNGGNIRVASGVNITVGLVDARTSTNRSAGTTTDQTTAWGSVSLDSANGSILDSSDTRTGSTTFDVYA